MNPYAGVSMYSETATLSTEDLVRDYAVLVKRIAHHLIARMPASVQVDDLIQSGMLGLIEAASKYDGGKGASFETYAGIRIRGAMLDEMRRGDWVPRSVHRHARSVSAAIHALEARLGREAADREVAAEMQLSLDEYYDILSDASAGRLFSYEEVLDDESSMAGGAAVSDSPNPSDETSKGQFQAQLADAIKTLSERDQLVLSLYYDEELNLKEIGAVLGVSESRVSQIHSQAALRLRSRLEPWRDK